ncbi:MAG: hypothetical protein ACKOBZ_01410 [Nitrospira sp.]|nr:hypothetical protein [Nitrospira sp.]
MRLGLLLGLGLLGLTGCATTEWVNLNNPRAEYATDFNACEQKAYNDPRYQGGMKLIVEKSRDQCMAKLGWRLREKRD